MGDLSINIDLVAKYFFSLIVFRHCAEHWMIIQSHAQVFPSFNNCLDYTVMNILCNP